MVLISAAGQAIAAQRGMLLCWVPICLAAGIGTYFALSAEPEPTAYAVMLGVMVSLSAGARLIGENWRPVMFGLALILLGVILAGARAHLLSDPVLGFRYYGPIQGRIVKIDRSGSDAVRLTLDQVVLKRMSPSRTPARVRVSLHGQQGYVDPFPGLTVILTGHLSPPSGPTEPGGYDFQRQAWFDRLGAVGYTRTPVLAIARPAADGAALRITRVRMSVSSWVQQKLPGKAGAFAAAVMTGDRSGMDQQGLEDLRASNLAHLLAISGLHMGLLTGFIFTLVRYGMALVPTIALRWPTKKLAAIAALGAGAAYLALSGGNVATERAYIMVAVMFVAVLMDRRAVTLRSVAVAACIVLVMRPEVLPEPGFQMSFAATTALVAVFGALRGMDRFHIAKWLRPVLAVVISSAVAGAATAPIAAAHFNRIADFGLIANLLSVPLMGLVVMPAAVLTACLAPFGLGGIGLAIMKPAILWILAVAHWVAELDGALSYVPTPHAAILPVFAVGSLWLILWQGGLRVRLLGLVPATLAIVGWFGTDRPDLLISDSGRLVGLMSQQGRVLNKYRGDGFAARSWLENDGDGVGQQGAFERAGISVDKGVLNVQVGPLQVVHISGRGAADKVWAACGYADLVITTVEPAAAFNGCDVYDPIRLRETGALAISHRSDKVSVVAAQERVGKRLWNSAEIRNLRPRNGQGRAGSLGISNQ